MDCPKLDVTEKTFKGSLVVMFSIPLEKTEVRLVQASSIHKKLVSNVVQFTHASDRISMNIIRLNAKYNVKIIQVYAPTSSHGDEEIEEFYEDINSMLDAAKTHYTVVMGDFNAKIGVRRVGESNIMVKNLALENAMQEERG